MQVRQVAAISLACVGGAFAFGVLANTVIDIVAPGFGYPVAAESVQAETTTAAVDIPAPTQGFMLASASSLPVEYRPHKVKTMPIVLATREPGPVMNSETFEAVQEVQAEAQVEPRAEAQQAAAIPQPRPRPAAAPGKMPTEMSGSIARQPAVAAIAAASPLRPKGEDDLLSPAHIGRMKTALALTAEQEPYWPAVAAELRAIAKQQPKTSKGQSPAKISVDPEAAQRLYWAAAPLITSLREDQKRAVRQLAKSMGLDDVASAI